MRTTSRTRYCGALSATFTADRTWGLAPAATSVFTAVVDGTNRDSLYYRWDFNADGTPDAQGPNLAVATNVYSGIGYYSVALSVSNAAGETAAFTQARYIKVGPLTYYVATNGGAVWPYTNEWASASPNLPQVAGMGNDQDTVLVSNGLYTLVALAPAISQRLSVAPDGDRE